MAGPAALKKKYEKKHPYTCLSAYAGPTPRTAVQETED